MTPNPLQHTREWFLARRGKLTSSRMRTIVHGGPKAWTTLVGKLRAELASDEILEPDLDYVPAIAHGRRNEPIARANLELNLGLDDIELVGFVTHPVFDYIGCSSDFVRRGPDGRLTHNGEIKCPLDLRRHLAVYQTGRMPDDHRPQVTCQMFVHGVDVTLFTSYHPEAPHWKMRTVVVEVRRDDAYVDYMLERCEQFRRVLDGEEPVHKKALTVPSMF